MGPFMVEFKYAFDIPRALELLDLCLGFPDFYFLCVVLGWAGHVLIELSHIVKV